MSQTVFSKIEYVDVREAIILAYSYLLHQLPYFDVVQTVVVCGVRRLQTQYSDSITVWSELRHWNIESVRGRSHFVLVPEN
jgi:hypothetical protein